MKVHHIPSRRQQRKTRVAAYCRVSTTKEEQEESIDFQKRYYRSLIQSRSQWEYVAVYHDEKSATSARKRVGFQHLIADAIAGRIDVILCKSISRFSRNIVDCQTYAQQLRGNGVDVIFEKEGIRLSDPGSEMMFALLGSVAQSESQATSEHVRVACEHRFAQGIYRMGNNRILGYDMGADGKLVPNKDAWMVELAFKLFVAGAGYRSIAAQINAAGGHRLYSDAAFSGSAIQNMLVNETYVGDKLLQKYPHKNYLTKRPDPGLPYQQYYLRDEHTAIIDRTTWIAAQQILRQRRAEVERGIYKNNGTHHYLYGKLFCGECGAPLTRRTLPAGKNCGSGYYKAWNCRERQKGKAGNGCKCRIVKEKELLCELATYLDEEKIGVLPDIQALMQSVARVAIYNDHIRIESAQAASQ